MTPPAVRRKPELRLDLPPTAIGKDFLPALKLPALGQVGTPRVNGIP
jgi:hypothetical protein